MKRILKLNLGVITALLFLAFATSALADDYYIYGDTAVSGYACGGYKINDTSGHLYVSQSGNCVVLLVSIPAGSNPHQHPSNPDTPSQPVVPRTFTHVQTYNFAADCGWSAGHSAAFYIDDTCIYYGVKGSGASAIAKWDKITTPGPNYGKFGTYRGHISVPGRTSETFGYDIASGKWFVGTRDDGDTIRHIYSCKEGDASWKSEFTYYHFERGGAGHHDGLTCNGGYVFVSDMRSDSVGQWWDSSGTWVEVGRYGYTDPESRHVEGMSFGPLDHFWATSGSKLYEFGGGKLQPTGIPTLTEWGMIIFCVLLFGWMAWVIVRRRRRATISM